MRQWFAGNWSSHRVLIVVVVILCSCAMMPALSVARADPPTAEEARRAAEEQRRLAEEDARRAAQVRERYREKSLCLAGTDTAYSTLEKLYAEFRKDRVDVPVYLDYTGGGDDVGVRELAAGLAEAALVREALKSREADLLAKTFPDPEYQPSTVEMGRLALILVTNESNAVTGLTLKQIEDIYRGTVTNWSEVGAAPGPIVRVGTDYPQLSWGMFLRMVLNGRRVQVETLPFRKEGYKREEVLEFYRQIGEKYKATDGKPFAMLASDDKVVAEVVKHKAAIGYCIHPTGKALPRGVRWVPIIPDGTKEGIPPTPENVLLGDYPLQVNIRWLVSPKASSACKEFISYVCGKDSDSVLRAGAIFSGRASYDLLAVRRLADFKAGEGLRFQAVGMDFGRGTFADMAAEYVKAKAVIQLGYMPSESDVSSVGGFVMGGTVAPTPPATQPEFRGHDSAQAPAGGQPWKYAKAG